jgi:hypothetical protein
MSSSSFLRDLAFFLQLWCCRAWVGGGGLREPPREQLLYYMYDVKMTRQ